jgi:hypothetical protein
MLYSVVVNSDRGEVRGVGWSLYYKCKVLELKLFNGKREIL